MRILLLIPTMYDAVTGSIIGRRKRRSPDRIPNTHLFPEQVLVHGQESVAGVQGLPSGKGVDGKGVAGGEDEWAAPGTGRGGVEPVADD